MTLPMPPADLRYRVAGLLDEAQFDASGRQTVLDFSRALSGVGRSMDEFARILEWGCGCGRILRHLPVDPARQEVHGCDIDGRAIDWLQANLPAFHTVRNEGLPPLPYPDGRFDLIVNHSVLTHLDATYQDAWLVELKRVLNPQGVLILTVHGDFAYEAWVKDLPAGDLRWRAIIEQSRKALDRSGLYFLRDDAWAEHFPGFYQSTFHTPRYVFEHWGRLFDILSYIPRGSFGHQDLIVLRHKSAALAAPPAPLNPSERLAIAGGSLRRRLAAIPAARAVWRRLRPRPSTGSA